MKKAQEFFEIQKKRIAQKSEEIIQDREIEHKGKKIRVSRLHQIGALLAVLSIIGAAFSYFYIFKGLPNPNGLKDYKVIPLSTQLFDRNGKLLFEIFQDENRVPIKLKDLPDYVKYAHIAIEDADFYKHGGISITTGILRAIKDSVFLQKGQQGGSTITQQLIKSALLTPERTIQRKVREIVLALWVEQIFTKDEILELYLNQVPYGGVAYGIEEASQTFFDKHAKDLTLPEAALLARLPQRPSYYSPYSNFDRAKAGQEVVLKRMLDLKFITKQEYDKAVVEKITIKEPHNPILAPHFVFYVRDLLEKQYGQQLLHEGGLKVTTTLDMDIQASSEAILREEVKKVEKLKVGNGAVLVTRPSTGEILTMVGSKDFFATGSGTFNVTTALRQPGSSIKPLNYAVALDRGLITAATIFNDIPTCFYAPGQPKSYCPVNYDGKYRGPVQMRFALGGSLNIPAVKTLAVNGVEDFVASSSGLLLTTLTDPQRYGLSLTLGGGEIKMTEMAQAFSSFANEGTPKPLVAILDIKDRNNKELYHYDDPNFIQDIKKPMDYPDFMAITGKRAFSRDTSYIISHILLDNNARAEAFGTSSQLVVPKKNVSVKTGTTNDLRDNWTIGYTPNFLVAVWVGNNDNSSMSRIASGVTGAAPIWNRVMRLVLADQKDLFPRKPDSVVGREVCVFPSTASVTPEQPVVDCQKRFEFFSKDVTLGKETGAYVTKEMVPINKDTGGLTDASNPSMEMQEKTILVDLLGTKHCLDCVQEAGRPNSIVNIVTKKEVQKTIKP